MEVKNKGCLLTVYSLGHLLVDLTSAFLMFSLSASGQDKSVAFVIYNFCAFALQMPSGLIADKIDRNSAVASSGLILTVLAFPLAGMPIVCAAVLGLGNCLYHVGAGTDVLGFDGEKQWMLGVFVSPGAIGLFIGTFLAKSGKIPLFGGGAAILLLSAAVIVALNAVYPVKNPSGNVPVSVKPHGRITTAALAALCFFSVVILRSYVGITLYTPWKLGALMPVLAVTALALGKTVGGFLADRFGAVRTAAATLALSALFFLFSEAAACGLLAIFLFNITMPLTLFAMARIFPNARGFSFGALTFALFLGCVPSFLSIPTPFYGEVWFHALEALISLVLLVVGLLLCKAEDGK